MTPLVSEVAQLEAGGGSARRRGLTRCPLGSDGRGPNAYARLGSTPNYAFCQIGRADPGVRSSCHSGFSRNSRDLLRISKKSSFLKDFDRVAHSLRYRRDL